MTKLFKHDSDNTSSETAMRGVVQNCVLAAVTLALLFAMSFAVDGEFHPSHLVLLAVPVFFSLALKLTSAARRKASEAAEVSESSVAHKASVVPKAPEVLEVSEVSEASVSSEVHTSSERITRTPTLFDIYSANSDSRSTSPDIFGNDSIYSSTQKHHSAGTPKTTPTRDARLDLLRLFAIAGVICIHAVDAMFPSITTGAPLDPAMLARIPDEGALDLYAAIRTCCYGFNIVYIMISGALLMRWKDEPLKDFYLKRVSKVLLPLLIYYFFYQWQNGLLFPLSASRVAGIFRGFFTADIELCPFYWLIYIIISLYLIYPFMRHMMKDLPYPALTVLAAGIAIFSGLVAYTPFVFAPVIGFWLGYAILGYWVTRPESRRFDWFLLVFGALQAVVIYLLIRRSTLDGTGYSGYMGLVTPYTPIMVFLCLGYFAFIYRLPARLFSDVHIARHKAAVDIRDRSDEAATEFSTGASSNPSRNDALKGNHSIRSRFLRFFSKYSFSAILVHWWVLYFILGRFYPQTAAATASSASANAAGIFRSLFSSGGIFRIIYDALLNSTGTHLALIWLVAADLILSVLIGALFEEYVLKAPLWLWDKACSIINQPTTDIHSQ